MKNKQILNKIKFIALAVVLGLGLNYVLAQTTWSGPSTAAPGGNKPNILNIVGVNQTKGGSGTPLSNALLNIEGTLSAQNLVVYGNAQVQDQTNPTGGDFYIDTINPTGTYSNVCVDNTHKLVTCAVSSGSVCGNGVVEGGEECDNGASNTNTGPTGSCTLSCTLNDLAPVGGGGSGYGPFAHCFVKNTQVLMADGTHKNIEDVQIGDVLKGQKSNNVVLSYHRPTLDGGKLYGFNGGRKFVTAEHPFMTKDGWKAIDPTKTNEIHNINIKVGWLTVGDTILTENGQMRITSIESESASSDTPLYNFKLSGDRTYYADGYLVHNKTQCTSDGGGYGLCSGGQICINNDGLGIPPSTNPPENGSCSLGCLNPDGTTLQDSGSFSVKASGCAGYSTTYRYVKCYSSSQYCTNN